MTDSQFVPGARVARTSWLGNSRRFAEDFVDKVHKSGNFTLRSQGAQQYRPDSSGGSAWETGDGFRKEVVILWTPEVDAEIRRGLEATRIRKLAYRAEELIKSKRNGHGDFPNLPAEKLAALEAFVAAWGAE